MRANHRKGPIYTFYSVEVAAGKGKVFLLLPRVLLERGASVDNRRVVNLGLLVMGVRDHALSPFL